MPLRAPKWAKGSSAPSATDSQLEGARETMCQRTNVGTFGHPDRQRAEEVDSPGTHYESLDRAFLATLHVT